MLRPEVQLSAGIRQTVFLYPLNPRGPRRVSQLCRLPLTMAGTITALWHCLVSLTNDWRSLHEALL